MMPLPPEPAHGSLLLDRDGSVWRRRHDGWFDISAPPDQLAWSWADLYTRFSPIDSFTWWDHYPKEETA